MPAHHRFGFDNHQRIAPVRPGCAQDRPEQPIQRAESGSWPLPFQDADLLAERQDFESNISAASEEDTRGGN